MPSLDRIDIFLEVARLRSFSAAAKVLGMTGPAISKQVMALEDELGIKLLHRTTRMVTLTDEGNAYAERVRPALEEIRDAASELQDRKGKPSGLVRINAPLSFGHMHLLPTLSGFAKAYPDIQLEVALEDRKVDIIAEGYDIVIRIGVLEDSSLVARMLAESPVYLVAAPSYLAAHGEPEKPADLAAHRFITFSLHGGASEWRYSTPAGKSGSYKMEGHFKANTAEMMLQAALDGVGIALLPGFSVSTHVKARQLVRLFPGYGSVPERSISALMPPNRYRLRKVQLLVDWIAKACSAIPPVQGL